MRLGRAEGGLWFDGGFQGLFSLGENSFLGSSLEY